jgi:Oxidoreductase NAD-binding domain
LWVGSLNCFYFFNHSRFQGFCGVCGSHILRVLRGLWVGSLNCFYFFDHCRFQGFCRVCGLGAQHLVARRPSMNARSPQDARCQPCIGVCPALGAQGFVCLQVLKAVLKDASDTTQLALLYANQTPDDVLLREELDALAAAHTNFRVWYTGK